jgi:hypothetical protein
LPWTKSGQPAAGVITKDATLVLVDAVMGFVVDMVQKGNCSSSKRNLITIGYGNSET